MTSSPSFSNLREFGDAWSQGSRHDPVESDWLWVGDFPLKSGKLLAIDAQYAPHADDGLLLDRPPGIYRVEATTIDYGDDVRISRLRAVLEDAEPVLGDTIGEMYTDTANAGLCDYEVFREAWGDEAAESWRIVEPWFVGEAPDVILFGGVLAGVAVLDERDEAILPFVSSGFGDGVYTVYELLASGETAGVEIEFIDPDEKYPFD